MAGVLDHLGAADDRRHGRVVLEVLEHLVDRHLVAAAVGGQGDGGHQAQRDGLLVGVQEAAADAALGAVAHEQHGRTLALGEQEAVLDDVGGKLEDLLDAHGHLIGLGTGVAQAALGEHGVGALGQDDHLGGDLVVAGAHAGHATGPVLDELLDGDAADVLGACLLGLLGQPLVERAAQHGVGVLALLAELGGGEVDGHLRARVHHGDALVGDFALNGRFGLEVGEDLLEGVGVDAAAGHVLGTGEVAALDDQDGLAGGCGHVSRHAARAARSHDDDVEI